MRPLKESWEHALLAVMVWREARNQAEKAQQAVVFTVLNRRDKPKWWGKTIDEIVSKKFQYSSMTDPNDKQLTKWPLIDDQSFRAAWMAVGDVLDGAVVNPVPGADSYHDTSIAQPYWAKTAAFRGKIGALMFYDVDLDFEIPKVAATIPIKKDETNDPVEFDRRLREFLSGRG